MRKPFDVLAEGLPVLSSRGDRRQTFPNDSGGLQLLWLALSQTVEFEADSFVHNLTVKLRKRSNCGKSGVTWKRRRSDRRWRRTGNWPRSPWRVRRRPKSHSCCPRQEEAGLDSASGVPRGLLVTGSRQAQHRDYIASVIVQNFVSRKCISPERES